MYDATRHRRSILSCANNLRQCISNSVHLPSPQPCSSCHVSGFSIFAFLIHLFLSPISGSRRIEFWPIFFDLCAKESLAGQSSPIGSPELLAHRLCHLRPIDPSIQSQLKVQRGPRQRGWAIGRRISCAIYRHIEQTAASCEFDPKTNEPHKAGPPWPPSIFERAEEINDSVLAGKKKK